MKPLSRKPVSKAKSAKQFRKHVSHTKAANVQTSVMRGGWRL